MVIGYTNQETDSEDDPDSDNNTSDSADKKIAVFFNTLKHSILVPFDYEASDESRAVKQANRGVSHLPAAKDHKHVHSHAPIRDLGLVSSIASASTKSSKTSTPTRIAFPTTGSTHIKDGDLKDAKNFGKTGNVKLAKSMELLENVNLSRNIKEHQNDKADDSFKKLSHMKKGDEVEKDDDAEKEGSTEVTMDKHSVEASKGEGNFKGGSHGKGKGHQPHKSI